MSQLRHPPDLTVYVDAPLEVRLERIARRDRHLDERRASDVSDKDLAVFAARDVVIRQLLSGDAGGRLVVNNGDRPIEEGAQEVIEVVQGRLAGRRGES